MNTTSIDIWQEEKLGRCDRAGQEYYLLLNALEKNKLEAVPRMLKTILQEHSWREWRWMDIDVKASTVDLYIERDPPNGLGIGLQLFRRLIQDDRTALALLDEAMQRPTGRPSESVDNINTKRPDGTSVDYTIRRLRKDEDHADIYVRWLGGEISANAAAIAAGYRQKPTPLEQAKKLISKLSKPDLNELRNLIDRLL